MAGCSLVEGLGQLEAALGHTFARPGLLVQALTHSSHAHERGDGVPHNEQLEFLGDAVLGFLVSARLVEGFPEHSEGRLSKIKAHLVSALHLYSAAESLKLGHYLQLGRGEEKSGGRTKRAVLVNALEALIAALYLDGGMEAAGKFVERFVVGDRLEQGLESFPFADYKSSLQEYLQRRKKPQPHYHVVEERGPQHRKTFTVEVLLERQPVARAEGFTKKDAEQLAARAALEHLREETSLPQQDDPETDRHHASESE